MIQLMLSFRWMSADMRRTGLAWLPKTLIRLINPDTFQGWALSKLYPSNQHLRKKSLVLRHDQEILDTSLAVSRIPVYYACLTWCCETRKSTSAVTNNAQIGEFHIQWTIISWETLVWMTTLYVSNDNDQYYRRQQTFPSYICPTQ